MKNVIFDMDGVIFDSEHVCERCWEDYKEKYKLKDAKGMFHACIGTTIERQRKQCFALKDQISRMRSLEKTHLIAFTKLKRQRGFL